MFKVAIITASDTRSAGLNEDHSTTAAADLLTAHGWEVVSTHLIPDEQDQIEALLKTLADEEAADLIVTTGGTGFAKRDVTPEATLAVVDKLVPGIPEYMRFKSAEITSRAMLSRAACGIRKNTLIVNLPGSPKAVKECLTWILEPLTHGVAILTGKDGQCGA